MRRRNRPVTRADEEAKERAREESGRGHRGAKTSAMVYGEIKEEEQQSNSIMTQLAGGGDEEQQPAKRRECHAAAVPSTRLTPPGAEAKQQMPGFLQVSSVTGLYVPCGVPVPICSRAAAVVDGLTRSAPTAYDDAVRVARRAEGAGKLRKKSTREGSKWARPWPPLPHWMSC